MENTTSFKNLNLIPPLEKALTKQGYTVPTPIQSKSIPGLLQGKDLIGIAQTGTGKTAAFILPILQRMTEKHPREIKTLVLTPTRELAAQIGESFSAYGEFLKYKHTVIFGGVGQGRQVQTLSHGVDILVATPGRLLDLMNQRILTLKNIEFFVLDEADRMLDMGFIHDIRKIISKLPQKRQSLFFSATMSPQINKLAKTLLNNPIHVEATPQATTVERIKQYIYFVDPPAKEKLLFELLKQKHLTSILVFTRTKHKANKVASFLCKNNISSERGIDIENISHVINFELPNEPESYVHRIGRTARAGTDGTAYSFCAAEERSYLNDIERLIRQKIEVMNHTFHSEIAQNAVGAAAKPTPKNKRSFSKNTKYKNIPKIAPKNKRSFSGNAKYKNRPKRRSIF